MKMTPSVEGKMLATPSRRANLGSDQGKAHKRARTETPQVPVVLELSGSPTFDDDDTLPRQDLEFENIESSELMIAEPSLPTRPALQVQKMNFSDAVQVRTQAFNMFAPQEVLF